MVRSIRAPCASSFTATADRVGSFQDRLQVRRDLTHCGLEATWYELRDGRIAAVTDHIKPSANQEA